MGTRYLVMLACGMDDIPLRLCKTQEEALTFAAKVKRLPKRIDNILSFDASGAQGVVVWQFAGGEPTSRNWVKDLD